MKNYGMIILLFLCMVYFSHCTHRCDEIKRYQEYFRIQIVDTNMQPIVGTGKNFRFSPDKISIYHRANGDFFFSGGTLPDSSSTFLFNFSLNTYSSGLEKYNPDDEILAFDTIFYIKYPDGDIDTLREFTIRFSETELAPCIHYEFGVQHDDSLYSSVKYPEIFKIVKR